MVLPLRIWGMEAAGKPFSALAHTLDITRDGARLGGVRGFLNPGDVIGVQYRHNKGRFRVVWTGDMNSPQATQVGVQLVEHGRDFWGLEGPEFKAEDEYTPPARAVAPQRALGRLYNVDGTVEVRNQDGKASYWAQVTQIGERGGYIKAHTPFAAGVRMQLEFNISNYQITTNAVVRTSQPGKGMMVEFTQLASSNDSVRLKSLIYGLESGVVRFEEAAKPAAGAPSVSQRLADVSQELQRIEEAIESSEVSESAGDEFRNALTHLRNTASALENAGEEKDDAEDAAAVSALRIRSAVKLCKAIGDEMRRSGLKQHSEDLRELMHSVEDLFTLLAGLNFTVSDEALPAEPIADVVALPPATAADSVLELDDIAVAAHLAHFHEHRARKKRKS